MKFYEVTRDVLKRSWETVHIGYFLDKENAQKEIEKYSLVEQRDFTITMKKFSDENVNAGVER